MDFVKEMDDAIKLGIEGFKSFIQEKIEADKDFLKESFWLPQNFKQMTVINYLIAAHQEPKEEVHNNLADVQASQDDEPDIQEPHIQEPQDQLTDLTEYIDYVLEVSEDKNVGEPLHQAASEGKTDLVFHLLSIERNLIEKNKLNVLTELERLKNKSKISIFDLDRRDNQGRTLISIILDLKIFELLMYLLAKAVNIHAATSRTGGRVMFQPLHQAVVLDSADAIRILGYQGAQLSNPLGVMKDTPLILAARLGKINALEALLEFPVGQLDLEEKNNNLLADKTSGHTAMEELCDRIGNNDEKDMAIRGVAMLLCRGAEPPSGEEMRNLLSNDRIALLKAIDSYLEDKPDLVEPFVSRCHVNESALHNIVYADHSWGSSIRHLFGVPSETAFMVERLVTRKYDVPQVDKPNALPLFSATPENLQQEKNHLKLYAEFVRRYAQAYDSQIFTNRWSTMRWMIAEGNCNWQRVLEYAKNHPTSRTRIVLGEMLQPLPKIHMDVENPEEVRQPMLS